MKIGVPLQPNVTKVSRPEARGQIWCLKLFERVDEL